MACKWLQERKGTRFALTVALQCLADARIITGPFFPQVWKTKIILIRVSTHSPYLSHRCFVGNVAGFLTWTTVWRGQPGGDPHLQLLLLPQQPPNFTNHTPAGGEREKVWQLFTQGRRGEDEKKKEGMERIKTKLKKTNRQTVNTIWGERQLFQFQGDEKSIMISLCYQRVWLFICSPIHKTI